MLFFDWEFTGAYFLYLQYPRFEMENGVLKLTLLSIVDAFVFILFLFYFIHFIWHRHRRS